MKLAKVTKVSNRLRTFSQNEDTVHSSGREILLSFVSCRYNSFDWCWRERENIDKFEGVRFFCSIHGWQAGWMCVPSLPSFVLTFLDFHLWLAAAFFPSIHKIKVKNKQKVAIAIDFLWEIILERKSIVDGRRASEGRERSNTPVELPPLPTFHLEERLGLKSSQDAKKTSRRGKEMKVSPFRESVS